MKQIKKCRNCVHCVLGWCVLYQMPERRNIKGCLGFLTKNVRICGKK